MSPFMQQVMRAARGLVMKACMFSLFVWFFLNVPWKYLPEYIGLSRPLVAYTLSGDEGLHGGC